MIVTIRTSVSIELQMPDNCHGKFWLRAEVQEEMGRALHVALSKLYPDAGMVAVGVALNTVNVELDE